MTRWALLLAALATAPAVSPAADPLQTRVDALAQQIQIRYRHHGAALEEQSRAAAVAVAAWNDGPQSEADRAAMERWLESALRATMAGGGGQIPAAPVFDSAQPVPPPVAVAPARNPPPVELVEPVIVERAEPIAVERIEPAVAVERREVAKPVLAPVPVELPRAPKPASLSRWSNHPAAAPLEWRANPFADDPAASVNPLRSGVRRESLRPVSPEGEGAAVNLTQLQADARGYALAVRELLREASSREDAEPAELAAAIDELERLRERWAFLSLYLGGLTPGQRHALPDVPTPEVVAELIRRKVDRALAEATPSDRATKTALRSLAERLAIPPRGALARTGTPR